MASNGDDYDILLLRAIDLQLKECDRIIQRHSRRYDFDSMDFEPDSIVYRQYVNACAMKQALTYYFNKFSIEFSKKED